MKKIRLSLTICFTSILLLLSLSSCLTGALSNRDVSVDQPFPGNIITVDDDGDGDYTEIKDAVNNANAGDTIEVYSGTYYECNITITKPDITLQGISQELGSGTGSGKPFIDGQAQYGNVIVVGSDHVTITGFHIENYGNGALQGGISIGGHHCIISDNDLRLGWFLIQCHSDNCSFLNNNLSDGDCGLSIRCDYSMISGNIFSDVGRGIVFWENSSYNIVTKNRIQCLDGIQLRSSKNNIIVLNHFEGNNQYGVFLSHSDDTVVKQNNFIDNKIDAFYIVDPFRWRIFDGGGGPNRWVSNYWGHSRLLPKFIFGFNLFKPWINVDWHPAQEPYDIS